MLTVRLKKSLFSGIVKKESLRTLIFGYVHVLWRTDIAAESVLERWVTVLLRPMFGVLPF